MDDAQDKQAKIIRYRLKEARVPTLPMVAQKLLELCQDEDANFATFAKVIESDQGLTSRIMCVANSAFYGLRIKATTLERAITALGLKQVRTIALGFHLVAALNKMDAQGFNMTDYWRVALLRGVFARQVAGVYCPARREEAFLIGLLQGSGVLMLAQVIGESYIEMLSNTSVTNTSLFKLEREIFGVDHIESLEIITKTWGLPDLLSLPMISHHRRSVAVPSLAQQVQLSQIAYFIGSLAFDDPQTLSEEDIQLADYCESTFGLDVKAIGKLLESARDEYFSVAKLFEEVLPEKLEIGSLLGNANQLLSEVAIASERKMFDCEAEVQRLRNQCAQLNNGMMSCVAGMSDPTKLTEQRQQIVEYIDGATRDVRQSKTTLTVFFIKLKNLAKLMGEYGFSVESQLPEMNFNMLTELFQKSGALYRSEHDRTVVALKGVNLNQALMLCSALNQKVNELKTKTMTESDSDMILQACIGMVHWKKSAVVGCADRAFELTAQQLTLAEENEDGGFRYQVVNAPTTNLAMAESVF
ncbi:MAG: HDOD domain-containing protein [Phycisphaerae bacterium]|nr:HDOD domain-containing protein [Phycisphaerae bacterium]